MGTTYTIKIQSVNYTDVVSLKYNVDQLLEDLNMIFSTYIQNSELSDVNNSHKQYNKLSDVLFEVLERALSYSKLSDGYYDPTVFPLVDLWGFGPNKIKKKPSDILIHAKRENVSYKYILLDSKNNSSGIGSS